MNSFVVTLFTHSQPFSEMFIISGKSLYCTGTFTNVLLTSLLACYQRTVNEKTNNF